MMYHYKSLVLALAFLGRGLQTAKDPMRSVEGATLDHKVLQGLIGTRKISCRTSGGGA
jgi:hypothetical protein